MIDAYLDHLRVERRLAGHTLESYARDLSALAAFADETGRQAEALDRASLEEFVRRQMTRGLSPRSVARAVAAVRGFYRFLVVDRQLDRNPTCARRARGRRCQSFCRSKRWTGSSRSLTSLPCVGCAIAP